MARHRSNGRRREPTRGRRLSEAARDIHTALWLTRRFMRIAGNEARRTARAWRRPRSRRARWRLG
jgi:hypothetical protein